MAIRARIAALAVPLALAVGVVVSASPAAAVGPVSDAGHIHHVDTRTGCVLIDAVSFLAEPRGLHRGASASGVGTGPEHSGC